MNLLTFDIEEWFLEYRKSGRQEKYTEYEDYLNIILDELDKRKFKATFFCVGEMGSLFPKVIRKIDERGHEVGCHSNIHTWLNKMTETECREDTFEAVDKLEQCVGKKIRSYRAPAFSIGPNNKWAFEILAENGIERDASVFPAVRDFGGFAQFGEQRPTLISYNGISMKEFPVPMTTVFGKQLAYSGGGYFRFFPLSFIKRRMAKETYAMSYFHIGDLVPESNGVMSKEEYENYFKENGTFINRYKRFVKANIGKKHAMEKMINLIDAIDYLNLEQADEQIDWNSCPCVLL